MRSLPWICVALTCIGTSQVLAQSITVRTFGHGATAAAAIDDGRRQALAEANAAAGERLEAATAPTGTRSRQVGPTRVIRTERLASGHYEVELVVEVMPAKADGSATGRRVVLLLDPDARETLLGWRLLDEARERLAANGAALATGEADLQARRLLERQRGRKTDVTLPDPAPTFDLLFVLTPDSPAPANAAGRATATPFTARLTAITAASGEIRCVTTVRTQIAHSSPDASTPLVQDGGRRIAAAVQEQTDRLAPAAPLVRVISVPMEQSRFQSRFHPGQQVVVIRSKEVPGGGIHRSAITTGEIISVSETSARVWVDRPLPENGRYGMRPSTTSGTTGIILDSDW